MSPWRIARNAVDILLAIGLLGALVAGALGVR